MHKFQINFRIVTGKLKLHIGLRLASCPEKIDMANAIGKPDIALNTLVCIRLGILLLHEL